jgi:predicted transcriptional regulator
MGLKEKKNMSNTRKTIKGNIVATPAWWAALDALAAHMQCTRSALVRDALKQYVGAHK